MFRGITAINIDAKGRMAIPSRYRPALISQVAGSLIVTIDTEDSCLLMYPIDEWEIIEHKLSTLPSFNRKTRRIQRLLIGHATEVDMDKQGRTLIPPLLREYAGIDKVVMLVGQGKKFEIWGEDQWHAGRSAWLQEKHDDDDSDGGGAPPELASLSL